MNSQINKNLLSKIKKIKVLALDVDGVLTNGKINIDSNGKEIKVFDVQDGFGVAIFQKVGYRTAIITARSSEAVAARAKDLKITKVFQNAYPKEESFNDLLKTFQIEPEEVCFVGDDFPDMGVLSRVGFAVAVKNASSEVKKIADYITKNSGGDGAVREVIEIILKAQGKWKEVLKAFI